MRSKVSYEVYGFTQKGFRARAGYRIQSGPDSRKWLCFRRCRFAGRIETTIVAGKHRRRAGRSFAVASPAGGLVRMSNGVTPNLPRLPETFLPPLEQKKSQEPPPPAFRSGSSGVAQTAPQAAPQPATQTAPLTPAGAAAAMSALTPSTAPVVNLNTLPSHPIDMNGPPAPTRKLTREEQAVLDQAHKQERAKRENEQRAHAAEAKQLAKQAEIDRKKGEEEQKRLAEVQKRQAAIDKAAEETAAKRAEEQAKRQAEIDKKNEKAVAEAQVKLKAAQAAYEAEIARSKKQ